MVEAGAVRGEGGAVAVGVLTQAYADLAARQDAEREPDAVVLALHQRLPAEHVGVPLFGSVQICDGQGDMGETGEVGHIAF